MNKKRNFMGVVIGSLLAANLWATLRHTPAAHAAPPAPEVEYLQGDYIIHDGRPVPFGPSYDPKSERETMMTELNNAAKKGWRVKGYSVMGSNSYSQHSYVLERPKAVGAM